VTFMSSCGEGTVISIVFLLMHVLLLIANGYIVHYNLLLYFIVYECVNRLNKLLEVGIFLALFW